MPRKITQALCGCAAALLLAGCAVLPNNVRVESEHVSHLTQHFGPDRTNYGYDSVGVVGRWQFGHAYIEAGDSYAPERLDGYHEVFEARFGYEFQVKP
jgi:hypothetical protein